MRSSGLIRGQGPLSKARRAASTAASMSAGVPSGTRATTSSVCGETTSIVSSPVGAAHAPSMNRVLRSRVTGRPSGRWSGSEGEPVGEAAGVVPTEGAVLEEPEAFGTFHLSVMAECARRVVDDAEHDPAGHGLVGEVVGAPLGDPGALPLPVDPVGVTAVAAADVDRHRQQGLDLEEEGLAV